MKILGYSVLGIVVLIVLCLGVNLLGLGIGFAWLPFYRFGAQLSNTQNTINIVYDAQRCINVDAQYQQLKTSAAAISSTQIQNAQTALTTFESKLPADQTSWSPQEQQEDGELQTNVTGLQQEESQIQAQYTALVARPDTQPCLGALPTLISLQ